jgi:hypothetical protein
MSQEPTTITQDPPSDPPVQEMPVEPTQESPEQPEDNTPQDPKPEEEPKEPKILLDIDEKNVPLCPKTNIQASNFFLGDDTKYAVHCVLCSNTREEVRRTPQLNLSLSLVLNEKLADQLFDEKQFQDSNWEGQVDDILADFKNHFDEQIKSFKELMLERLQNESHEFMLKKIKSFLDQARSEYKEEPRDFSKLQELCSTFNDFLLLKKSDEVATAEQEIKSFKKYFDSMKKTLELNFKYLNSKIEGKHIEETPKARTMEAPVMSFSRPMETSVVVNSTMPVSYGYQAPTQVKPATPNRVIGSNDGGFFDNIAPQNGIHSYTNVIRPSHPQRETVTSSRPYVKSQQNVEVRGVSPGLRTIKKVRVSQRSGTPQNVRVIRKSANAEHNVSNTRIVSRNASPYTETVSHVNGIKIIRRSISASNRNSQIRSTNVNKTQAPSPSFNAVEEILNSSSILTSPASRNFVKSGLFPSPMGLVLLYRGSTHGMGSQAFHSRVDNKGPTLSLFRAKETGAVFGGYNDKTWLSTENGECLQSDSSFLFSVDKRTKHELIGNNNHNAIGCYGKHGPVFGKFSSLMNNKFYYNYDLFIGLSSNNTGATPSSSALGKTYKLPEGIQPDSNEARSFLANTISFTIDEIEVYGIVPKRGYN